LDLHVAALPDLGATPSMKGRDSVSTLVRKVFRLGVGAFEPDPSLYFSSLGGRFVGVLPLPPNGSWEIDRPSSRTVLLKSGELVVV